jgi:hypothetical protein
VAIQPDISLGIRTPQVESPMDALHKAVSIADMIAQTRERQQIAKQRQLQAPVLQAQSEAELRKLAEDKAMDEAFNQSATYNPEVGDIEYDQAKGAAHLQSQKMAHLLPTYQDQVDKRRTAHRNQVINESNAELERTKDEGEIAENFLALEEPKRDENYINLRRSLVGMDPGLAQALPQKYDASVADNLKKVVDHRQQVMGVADKLKEAQQRETLEKVKDDQLSPEDRWKKYNPNAGEMPAWYKNAVTAKKSGINPPAATTYQDKKITTLNGNNLPEDAIDREGNAIPDTQRTADTLIEQRQDPGGKIYYQVTKSVAKGTKEKEHERIEKAYAFAIGKKYENLTDGERVAADGWYTRMTPQKQTEFDKRLGLYEKSPETYSALFGHGANVDKPVTAAQKATILGRINTEISRQGLSGQKAVDFRNQRLQELKEAGVEMAALKAGAVVPPGSTGYGPTEKRVLAKDMGAHKKGETINVRKNLKTGGYEEVR